jgi:hypothetical protein
MYPKDKAQATHIVCQAAAEFIHQRRTGSHNCPGPLTIGGDVNPDKVTEAEIEGSIKLLMTSTDFGEVQGPFPIETTPPDPTYSGPRPCYGRNCYGSNLPSVSSYMHRREHSYGAYLA